MKNWKDWFMMILAIVVILGVLATILLLVKYEIPKENTSALYLIIGNLVAGFLTVLNYFYGSSKGFADKTEVLVNGKSSGLK